MSAQPMSRVGTARAILAGPVKASPSARQGYLRLVPQRRSSAPRTPFVAVVVALLVVGLLGLLLLNTVLAQDAFRLHVLQTQGSVLANQELDLQRQVEGLRAPAGLASRARALGLVQGGPPAFLRLSDGAILGQPVAAVAPSVPVPPRAATTPIPTAVTAGKAPATATKPGATKGPAGQLAARPAATKAPQGPTTSTAPHRGPAPAGPGGTH